ncbi:MAG: PA14 domain-containing protein [Verrucomicrobiales bacterium]|nr:PA14 domain-containing protein [Verrucomicrobiales bacterium]
MGSIKFLLSFCVLFIPIAGIGQDKVEDPGARTWSHSDGRRIKAGIVDVVDNNVILKAPNGKSGPVELVKLSKEDQEYIAKWIQNNAAPKDFGKPDTIIEITTLKGEMKYNKPIITVYPGKKIKLILRNQDDMHHNLAITKPGKGKDMKVAQEAWKLGADGFAKHWIPKHPDLLFASKMADPHSSSTLYFTAPKRTGKYPYVCTLPGHAQVMRGTMIVSKEVNPLSELTFTLFKGSWKKIPDWNKIEPSGTDHVPSGKFDLSCTKEKDSFGIVFRGNIEAPKSGDYVFTVSSDDGSRLLIDRKIVIDHDGIHGDSPKSGKIKLDKGSHHIEVQYFEGSGGESLYVGWKTPGSKKETPLSVNRRPSGGNSPSGQLLVAEEEARIYRNFIQGAGSRAIGVGYPGGLNLAYDANNMRIAMLWLGDFIDAKRHWNGRGQGYQPPAGESVINGPPGVPFAAINNANESWPDSFIRKDNAQLPPIQGGYIFKGYKLTGEERIPTFRYTFGTLSVEDMPSPEGSYDSSDVAFKRSIRIKGEPVKNLYFRAAVGQAIELTDNNTYLIDDSTALTFKSDGKPVIREIGEKKELLVPIQFSNDSALIEQTINWQ